jgi:hypothetical protein
LREVGESGGPPAANPFRVALGIGTEAFQIAMLQCD